MYEETVERIARMIAEDNGDPQHWGVYATMAMEVYERIAKDMVNGLLHLMLDEDL
jgi:hypothetical protein